VATNAATVNPSRRSPRRDLGAKLLQGERQLASDGRTIPLRPDTVFR